MILPLLPGVVLMRRLFPVLALAMAVACGGDKSTNPNSDSIEGTYSLRTVNGSPLPFTFQSGTTSVTLTSDVITVAGNGSWTESIGYRQTANGQTTTGTDTDGGSWVRAGSSVTLNSSFGTGGYAGTYGNGSLTFSDAGFVEVFSR